MYLILDVCEQEHYLCTNMKDVKARLQELVDDIGEGADLEVYKFVACADVEVNYNVTIDGEEN